MTAARARDVSVRVGDQAATAAAAAAELRCVVLCCLEGGRRCSFS
eukprot:COSAG02_NODE_2306_length_9174_cov_10.715152_1_plen_44_part_10